MYSRTLPLSLADQSSQLWLYAYTSLSYLDNTSATAETFAFLCAVPSTTRGHALYFRPRETEFLLLPLGLSGISILLSVSPTLANDNNGTVEFQVNGDVEWRCGWL